MLAKGVCKCLQKVFAKGVCKCLQNVFAKGVCKCLQNVFAKGVCKCLQNVFANACKSHIVPQNAGSSSRHSPFPQTLERALRAHKGKGCCKSKAKSKAGLSGSKSAPAKTAQGSQVNTRNDKNTRSSIQRSVQQDMRAEEQEDQEEQEEQEGQELDVDGESGDGFKEEDVGSGVDKTERRPTPSVSDLKPVQLQGQFDQEFRKNKQTNAKESLKRKLAEKKARGKIAAIRAGKCRVMQQTLNEMLTIMCVQHSDQKQQKNWTMH